MPVAASEVEAPSGLKGAAPGRLANRTPSERAGVPEALEEASVQLLV